jgi:hypothetical protein
MKSLCAAITSISLLPIGFLTVISGGPAIPLNSPKAGTIVATGDMTAVRFDHAAALLRDGRVLIVGGIERNGVMNPTAELFDPATGAFHATEKPQFPHGWGVTATLLTDGKVLVAGGSSGCDGPCYTAAAELYDARTGTFTSTGRMTTARAEARSLLLPNGDVLVAGGTEPLHEMQTAELYRPASGTFSLAGTTHLSDIVQMVLLKDGRVLLVGASGAELYDPSTGRFTPTGGMTVPRTKFGAALLPDGRVLIAGGQTGGPWGKRVARTEIYDPKGGKFVPGPELNTKRFKLSKAVVSLTAGRVLVAGGAEQPEIYDPAANAFFSVGGSKLDAFCFSTATLLNDGRVLLAGGYARPGSPAVNHAWLYEP